MPNQYRAAYQRARGDQLPPGRLVHVDDAPGAQADIYLHPLHARRRLIAEFNALTRHQVGSGLWQQRWTHEGRIQEPTEGLKVAVSRWEILPADAMPRARVLLPVEERGSCIWLIKEGYCTRDLRDEMNAKLERIAGDALWVQYWYKRPDRAPGSSLAA